MIIKFSEYLRENSNKVDILIIVDVQKEFEKFIQNNLVEELNKYCQNFYNNSKLLKSNSH